LHFSYHLLRPTCILLLRFYSKRVFFLVPNGHTKRQPMLVLKWLLPAVLMLVNQAPLTASPISEALPAPLKPQGEPSSLTFSLSTMNAAWWIYQAMVLPR